jgi:hypothetical protein
VVEPPPAATLLGRIFAHRTQEGTVVRAPLVRVDDLARSQTAAEPDVPDVVAEPEAAAPPVAPESEGAARPAAPEAGPATVPPAGTRRAPMPEPAPEPAPEPVSDPVAERAATPPAPRPRASRYCPVCADRVAVAADGLHCHLGHKLSPAHGRRRRWFGRHA